MMTLTEFHALLKSPSSRLWSECEAAMVEFAAKTLADPQADATSIAVAKALVDQSVRAQAFALLITLGRLSSASPDDEVRQAVQGCVPAIALALSRLTTN